MLIGDKRVGKTTLLVELAKKGGANSYVKVIEPSYKKLIEYWYSERTIEGEDSTILQADVTKKREKIELKIEVKLPSDDRTLKVLCVDTPGEFWAEQLQQKPIANQSGKLLAQESLNIEYLLTVTEDGESFVSLEWQQQLINDLKTVKGIILLLAPPRSKLIESRLKEVKISQYEARFLEDKQWKEQVKSWLDFLKAHVTEEQRILICLNMADLFCDHQIIARKLRYEIKDINLDNIMNWQKRHDYVLNNYFIAVKELIEDYNIETDGNLLQTFITTKADRSLLELPWLYLANDLPLEE